VFRQCSLNSHRSSSRLARASLSTHSTARQVGTGGRPPRHRRRSRIAGHPSYPVLGRRQAAPPMHLLLIQYCRQQSSFTESNPRLAPPPSCAFDACQRQQTRPQSNRRVIGSSPIGGAKLQVSGVVGATVESEAHTQPTVFPSEGRRPPSRGSRRTAAGRTEAVRPHELGRLCAGLVVGHQVRYAIRPKPVLRWLSSTRRVVFVRDGSLAGSNRQLPRRRWKRTDGLESGGLQLHPYDQAVLPPEGGLSRSGASGRRPFRFLHPVRAGDHPGSSAVGCLAEIVDEA
jgi:hypothetical protein